MQPQSPPALIVRVEAEEEVDRYEPANNGASPMWCMGSTCLVRAGQDVFASGIETFPGAKPLHNVRWVLFRRGTNGWELLHRDEAHRTREPAPLLAFSDGPLFLSANPTLTAPEAENGPAQPELLAFSARDPRSPPKVLLPEWSEPVTFTEHSYRNLAADATNRELILFQNRDYDRAYWSFLDREVRWSACGKLVWP